MSVSERVWIPGVGYAVLRSPVERGEAAKSPPKAPAAPSQPADAQLEERSSSEPVEPLTPERFDALCKRMLDAIAECDRYGYGAETTKDLAWLRRRAQRLRRQGL